MVEEVEEIEKELENLQSHRKELQCELFSLKSTISELSSKILEKVIFTQDTFLQNLASQIVSTKAKIEELKNVEYLKQLEQSNCDLRSKTRTSLQGFISTLTLFDNSLSSLDQPKLGFEKLEKSFYWLLNDKQDFSREIDAIKSNMACLECKNERVKVEIFDLQNKSRSLESELKELKQCENETADKIAAHILNETQLAADLILCKSALAEARITKKRFRVRRVWMLSTTLCFLCIIKSSFEYAIKVQESSSFFILKFSEIDSIFLHPAKKFHFFLKSTENSVQEYFSESSEEIVSLVRELMFSQQLRV